MAARPAKRYTNRRAVSPAHPKLLRGFALCLLLLGMTQVVNGCRYPTRGQSLERLGAKLGWSKGDGSAFDTPQMRLGTMPFDTWYSPFKPLSADALGTHRYMPAGELVLISDEVSRGSIYTTRAGFVDVAHVRNSIDLTRFAYEHVMDAMLEGRRELRMLAAEPDFYNVSLNPPAEWKGAEPGSEAYADAQDASARIAGRLAYLMTTWHEVVTWYGYKGMAVVTEKPSAFSYDDAPSHMIGVEVAMRVLAGEPDMAKFDDAVTQELCSYLEELGAVTGEEAERYMERARSLWWDGMQPRMRLIHMGLEGEALEPKVLDDQEAAVRWIFRPDESVAGHVIVGLYDVEIEPHVFEAPAIRRAMDVPRGRPLHPRTDFVALRQAMLEAGQP